MSTPPVLILDNGAHTIKAGIAGDPLYVEPRLFPNSIVRSKGDKKTYIADEVERCRDFGGLQFRNPFERGMLTAWECEKRIWDRVFSQLHIKPSETSLLVTEPYFNLPSMGETYDQMIFEEWEFESCYRCAPASLIPHGGLFGQVPDPVPTCMILVDVGYSYTHVVPMFEGKVVWDKSKRIDIGGKLLTNHLKQLVSFRQWNMMDETYLMEKVREECCYVSMDWRGDLEMCKRNPKKNPIVQQYVLPDFSPGNTKGYIISGPNAVESDDVDQDMEGIVKSATPQPKTNVKQKAIASEEQILWMNNERFTVPEVLFNPSDIGLKQAGLPESIASVIRSMPVEHQGMYWGHVGLFGGVAGTEAIGERLDRELRALCPAEWECGLFEAYDPVTPAYYGAQALAMDASYHTSYPLTRQEYLEYGSEACRRRFATAQGLGGIVRKGDEVNDRPLKKRGGGRKGKKKQRKQRYGAPSSDEEVSDEDDYI